MKETRTVVFVEVNDCVIHELDEGVGMGVNSVFLPNFLIISFFSHTMLPPISQFA